MPTGEEIKNAIKGKGFTIGDAATKLRTTRQTLYNQFNRSDPDPAFLQNVKTILGVEFNDEEPALSNSNNIYAVKLKSQQDIIKAQQETIEALKQTIIELRERLREGNTGARRHSA